MSLTIKEICEKDVVDLKLGKKLGKIDDIVFLKETGKIEKFIIYGRKRMFGLFGKEENVEIPLESVTNFGEDIIMVRDYVLAGTKERNHALFFRA